MSDATPTSSSASVASERIDDTMTTDTTVEVSPPLNTLRKLYTFNDTTTSFFKLWSVPIDELTDSEQFCPICLDEFFEHPDVPIMKLKCAHVVCKSCVSTRFSLLACENRCPLCRAEQFELPHWTYPHDFRLRDHLSDVVFMHAKGFYKPSMNRKILLEPRGMLFFENLITMIDDGLYATAKWPQFREVTQEWQRWWQVSNKTRPMRVGDLFTHFLALAADTAWQQSAATPEEADEYTRQGEIQQRFSWWIPSLVSHPFKLNEHITEEHLSWLIKTSIALTYAVEYHSRLATQEEIDEDEKKYGGPWQPDNWQVRARQWRAFRQGRGSLPPGPEADFGAGEHELLPPGPGAVYEVREPRSRNNSPEAELLGAAEDIELPDYEDLVAEEPDVADRAAAMLRRLDEIYAQFRVVHDEVVEINEGIRRQEEEQEQQEE